MSQITLRGDKGSALTYGELDQNFTTIGLADGMDTTAGNVAISVDTVTATTANLTTINTTSATIDDINIGDTLIQNKSFLPATGIDVVSPETEEKWSIVQLQEYDANSKPNNIHNPSIIVIINSC